MYSNIVLNNITIMGVYEGSFQIAFNNITIMGMNKIDEHKYIELEHNNNSSLTRSLNKNKNKNKNIMNKINEHKYNYNNHGQESPTDVGGLHLKYLALQEKSPQGRKRDFPSIL